ncbi:transposase [Spirosoma soli]|uniref:Transposase n=1 Tax=Spirosoma soli TaxID=1770529 RepID=A0ABW5LXA5_9BACT
MQAVFSAVKYGVGVDMGKDKFYASLSAIDQGGRIKIKATHSFANTAKGITEFHRWVDHHAKEKRLPLYYLMEATGVYYEPLALSLHQRGAHVCVVLPQKAKHYLKALGLKTKTDGVDAQGLATMACQQWLEAWQPLSEAMYKLRQLTRQQIHLQEVKTQMGNQLMNLELSIYTSPEVKKQLTKLIHELEKQITECEKLIAKAVNDNPEWKRKVEQICAIKGVGLLTVANLITETNEFTLFENQPQRRTVPVGQLRGV